MKKNVFHPLISKLRAFTAGWVSLTFLTLIFAIPQAAAPPEPSESPAFRQPVASSSVPHTSVSSEAKDTPQLTPTVSEQNTVTHLTPVYYNQKDALWKDAAYGSDSIGGYGCGPTVCAMIISTLTSYAVTPVDMADWSVKNGCYFEGGGSYHDIIPLACKSYGLLVQGCDISQTDEVLNALKNGALVAVIMGPGDFTATGHFILLYGVDEDGKILVSDPADRSNCKAWDSDIIFSQAKNYAAGGGPFWIITAKS